MPCIIMCKYILVHFGLFDEVCLLVMPIPCIIMRKYILVYFCLFDEVCLLVKQFLTSLCAGCATTVRGNHLYLQRGKDTFYKD